MQAQAVGHYENFPVASLLCPPHLRAPVMAIYHFARTADDIADEGDASPQERLDALDAYRADLAAAAHGGGSSARWPQVFDPLARAIAGHRLPERLLTDLLDAFAQDIAFTRDARRYADRAELADYCRRSANPVGRLLLHLYGTGDAASLAMSDRICTALQLINFWQDPSVDIPRGRLYFTTADCERFGVDEAALRSLEPTPEAARLVADCCAWARAGMLAGAPLVHRIPGRAGWELRLVVQGGLRILDRIAAIGHRTLERRPTVGARDLPVMLWRALRMGQSRPTTAAS
ncbi:squalene synthase HpnC [Xylophilus sp.]|uniref:squalene synthase HpnC n=1 Tax=Xylophilus sp. TaxID=2653893 RepID=UPI002D804C04|nr:squalene synthase HpnC [Xylophilus sp.]